MVYLRRELTDIVDDACLMASAAAPSAVLIPKCHPACHQLSGLYSYSRIHSFIHSDNQEEITSITQISYGRHY